MYLSLNYLAFYSYMLGKETKLLLRYSDITDISRSRNSINIRTLNRLEYSFGILFAAAEIHNVIEQLSKMAMQKLIQDPDSPTFDGGAAMLPDGSGAGVANPRKLTQNPSSKKSYLLRDLNARQQSDEYRIFFRLPQSEVLDGTIKGKYKRRLKMFKSIYLVYFSKSVASLCQAICWREDLPFAKPHVLQKWR